jgi:hypothetical protein
LRPAAHGAQVKYGQQLRVVGNLPALGSWDTARGLELRWSEGHVWAATLELEVGSRVEFKVRPHSRWGFVAWEQGRAT